jgi:hypothetical protein
MLYGATATTCIATPRARHISSYFLRCALLAPNMHSMFSRGGVLGGAVGDKEGRSHEKPWDSAGIRICAL